MTISLTTLRIMTLSITVTKVVGTTTLSITTFSIMLLSKKELYVTLSINDFQWNNTLPSCSLVKPSVVFYYCCADCHNAGDNQKKNFVEFVTDRRQ
jgi:hypothetical protein